MKLKLHIIDAFTKELFKGNPAAVVPLTHWLPEKTMQAIASENNLSETAFFVQDSDGVYHIRWFSPLTEMPFCGHATLASAFVIFEQNLNLSEIKLHAPAVGNLSVKKQLDGRLEMNFPRRDPVPVETIPLPLLNGLSITPAKVLVNQQAYFAIYDSEQQVLDVVPDLAQIASLGPLDVVVTARGSKFDFVSRYFWPANGGAEDPVTGSIHAGLAPYWSSQIGSLNLTALQASKRGGVLHCRVEVERVFVSGYAKKYLEGEIYLA